MTEKSTDILTTTEAGGDVCCNINVQRIRPQGRQNCHLQASTGRCQPKRPDEALVEGKLHPPTSMLCLA